MVRGVAAVKSLHLRGAYGLSVADHAELAPWLVPAPVEWPVWRIGWQETEGQLAQPPPAAAGNQAWLQRLTADHAEITLARGGSIALDRASREATLGLAEPVGEMELLHPMLSAIGSIVARWQGRYEIHAGAVAVDGAAWGLLGDKGAGKSSLLAWCLLQEQLQVVSDDLLVVDPDGSALAGPRCVDLRADVAERFEIGEPIGRVGGRDRWRVRLPEGAACLPLAGWIQLAWGDQLAVDRLSPSETFAAVARSLAIKLMPDEMTGLMRLADLPGVRIRRPRRFEATENTGGHLLRAVLGAAP